MEPSLSSDGVPAAAILNVYPLCRLRHYAEIYSFDLQLGYCHYASKLQMKKTEVAHCRGRRGQTTNLLPDLWH